MFDKFNRAPQAEQSIASNEEVLERLERSFFPYVETAVMDANLRIGDVVMPGSDGTYMWNRGQLGAVVSSAYAKAKINKKYKACEQAMDTYGVTGWKDTLIQDAYKKAIAETMQQTVIWGGSLTDEKMRLIRRLPFANEEIPVVQDDWLDFMLKGTKTLYPEVLRRACDVYGNISTLVHKTDPSIEQPRGIIAPNSRKVVAVDTHALQLLNRRLEEAAAAPLELTIPRRGTYAVTEAEILQLRELSFRQGVAAKTNYAESVQRGLHSLAERRPETKTIINASTAAAIMAGTIAQPAAATAPTNIEMSAPALSVNAPKAAQSYVFVETISQTANGAVEASVAIPMTYTPSSAPVGVSQESPTARSGQQASLGVEFAPAYGTSPVTSKAAERTSQTTVRDTDPLEKLRADGLSAAELAEAASTLGLTTPSVLPDRTGPVDKSENMDPNSQAPVKPLARTNALLDRFVTKNIDKFATTTTINGTTEAVVTDESFRMAQMHLKGATEDIGRLSALSPEDKQKLVDGLSPAQTAVVNSRAAEFLAQIQRGENGKAVGLNEAQQKDLAALLAITSLGAENPSSANTLVNQAQAEIDRIAAEAAAKKAAEEAAAAEAARAAAAAEATKAAAEAPAAPMSDHAMELKALEIMMQSGDIYIARGAQVTKELMTLPENLDGAITRQIAFGAVANTRDETGTENLDFSTKQKRGPAVGAFQWEGKRKTDLFAFADRHGEAWTDQTVQLMNVVRELEGPESAAWDRIKNANSSEEAATRILQHFERAADSEPGGTNDDERRVFAAQLEQAFQEALAQVQAEQKALEEQRAREAAEAEKAAAEAIKYPEIWSGFSGAERERLVHILDNVKRDKSQLLETFLPANEEILRNKGYENGKLPDELMKKAGSKGHQMLIDVADAYEAMNTAFRTEYPGRDLTIGGDISAYRNYQEQVETKKDAEKKGRGDFAADPGTSNHGWASALDMFPVAPNFDTIEYKWLIQNGWKYGFFHNVRHMENGPVPEPWHWEKKN